MSASPPLARVYRRVYLGMLREQVGTDLTWAHALPRPLADAGLADVDAVGVARPVRGGTLTALTARLTLEQLRPAILATGALTEVEIEAATAVYDDPGLFDFMGVTMAAWGRRRHG